MKKVFILTIILIFHSFFAMGQSWLWGKTEPVKGSTAEFEGMAVATDKNKNVFLAGELYDTLIAGSNILISSGQGNSVIMKYDSSGNLLWAKQSSDHSSSGVVYPYSLATDLSGNCYMTGSTGDSAGFGPYIFPQGDGYFVVKYDKNGNVVKVISNGAVEGDAMSIDNEGNIYVLGTYSGKIIFGTYTLNPPANNASDYFLVKYDSNFNVKWVESSICSSTGQCYPTGLAVDINKNVFVCGGFTGTAKIGSFTDTSLGTSAFIAKYDSNGNALWTNQSQCTPTSAGAYCQGYSVTTDKSGSVYFTGTFYDTIKFGSHVLAAVDDMTNDVFVVKYNPNGTLQWSYETTNPSSSNWVGYSISSDTLNNIYLIAAGYLNTSISPNHTYKVTFNGVTYSTTVATQDGASLILELTPNGKVKCGSIIAGGGDDNNAIVSDPSGKYIYVGGDLSNDLILGGDTIGDKKYEYSFVARWEPCNDPQSINEVVENDEVVKVFPNPSTGIFTFNFSGNNEKANLIIYNMLGESICK
ncbi:MAG TPA: hypothetical protein VK783_09285, partial [Bacteroidia bacterium]|nr:hypothetical protein [Bacteroidia bacterium]